MDRDDVYIGKVYQITIGKRTYRTKPHHIDDEGFSGKSKLIAVGNNTDIVNKEETTMFFYYREVGSFKKLRKETSV